MKEVEESRATRSPFINTRCRLQRLKDAKFFAGWVKDLTASELRLRLSTRTALMNGDIFSTEIHGTDRCAMFNAQLVSQHDDELVLEINHIIRFMPSREQARLRVEGIGGTFDFEGEKIAFGLSDVSMEGCGLVVPIDIPRSTRLEMTIDTPQGLIICTGGVRYCKPDAELPGAFHLGLRLEALGRLESARWTKLYEFYSAA